MSKTFHCFFEQSGTFKKEFRDLGYEAYDYDILDDYGQTDFKIDLYEEINKAYDGKESIFDNIKDGDEIIAFFPCTRFEHQVLMYFTGDNYSMRNWDDMQKLKYCIKLHAELDHNYQLISRLTCVCLEKGIPLIIENPYSTQHYLTRYWPIKPKVIDYDRTKMGDHFKKPTQYWFIGREPSNNFIFEPQTIVPRKKITELGFSSAERSEISPIYANRFIREFVI